ncbi:MAG: HNH endonuclease [Acidobacteriota bacterium]
MSNEDFSPTTFSIEHIVPIDSGGLSIQDNLALACQSCNNFKYNKISTIDPITQEVVPFFNPRTDLWHEHFTWNQDFTELLGLTPIGRATIEGLKLNRVNVVNLRRVLIIAGKHPPLHHPNYK